MGKTRQLGDIVSNGLVSVATTTDTLNIGTGITFFGTTGIASVTGLYVNGTEITSSGGGGGVSDIVEDTTPQLGGDLDLNSNDITGSGNISITGNLNITGIATVQSKLHLLDSDEIVLGTDEDFDIFHDGSHGYLENKTGDLFIRGGGDLGESEGGDLYIQSRYNQNSIKCVDDAGVTLYHSGNARLDTVSGGITLTGSTNEVTVSSASTDIIINPLSGGAANTGKVIIQGNLQVDGETTTINSTTLTIDDKSIVVASGATDSASANGAGIQVDGASATFQYSHTGTKWVSNKTIEATSFIKNGGAATEFLKADGSVDTNTYLTSETSHTDVLVDGDFGSAGFMKRGASAGAYSISATIGTSEIADDAVTYAKIQNVSATNRILGRDSANAGVIEEIAPADVRTMLNVADGANNYSHPNHSGDVTSLADGATTISDNVVTHAKYQQVATDTIIGRTDAQTGNVTALTATEVRGIINVADGANNYVHPNHSGDVTSTGDGATVIAGAAVTTAKIADDAVTYAKIQNVSATNRILGRDSANAGVIEEIAPAALRTMINVEDGANNYSHPNHSGDVTSLADGATTIADEAVTFAKMQHINQNIILGRSTANAGDVEALGKTDVLTILNVADGANAYTHPDHTGDVTSSADGATTIAVGVVTTAKIADDAVTYAKIQDVSATNTVLGRISQGSGVVEELTGANIRTIANVADGANNYSHPNHSGDVTSQADGATTIANNAVTHAKYQQVATDTIIGRTAAGSGDVTALTATEVRGIINVADGATAYGDSDVDTHLNQSNPTSGYVLSWNGSDYAWVAQSGGGGTPGGTNTAVQYNNSGSFAGIATLMSIDATNHHVAIGTAIDIIPYDTQNNGTLSFEGSAGQLFSIENNLSSGSIFSVNDVSGLPSIDVDADGTIQLAPLSSTEYVGIGTTNPQYKLHVIGDVEITGTLTNNGSSVGGGGVSDGDKGDITVSNSGATWTIDSDVVTYDKMQDLVTANRVLGGTAAGTISEVQVQTAMVADDAVTYAKIQNVSATDRLLGRDSAGAGVIEEITPANVRAMLNVADGATAYSNSDVDSHLNQSNPTSGYVLSWNGTDYAWVAQSGGGISNVVEDTTPQLGGNLDVNGNDIQFGDDDFATFGASNDLLIYHAVSTNVDHVNESYLTAQNGGLNLEANSGGHVRIKGTYQNGTLAKFNDGGAAELYHDGNKKLETTNGGVTVTGIVTATSFVKSGGTSSQYLMADGSTSTGGGGSSTLSGLTDVSLSSPSNGQVLKYNGTNWVNGTDEGGAGSGVSQAKATAISMVFG